MLVLTRKLQQQVKIGEQITVTILRVKGNTVRVGIQAPRDVRVVRGEIPKRSEAAETSGEAGEIPPGQDAGQALDEVLTIELPSADVSGANETVLEADEANVPSIPAASHLPLAQIRQRRGSAPLKQLVAAAALAK
jgi:carbon storage regulator CsrA